jgi:hypothetical protein
VKPQEQKEGVEVFRYPKSVFTAPWIGTLLPLISFILAFLSWPFSIGAVLIFLFSGLFFSALTFQFPIKYATIFISDQGISAFRFGRIWRFIPWAAVKKIVRVIYFDPGVQKPLQTYYVQDTERNLQNNLRAIRANFRNGPLTFNERILDYRKLLNLVNEFARQNNIRLVEIDRFAASQQSRSLWRQIEPKEQEVNIEML